MNQFVNIKDQFREYLSNCVKSGRSTNISFIIGKTAVDSYVSFAEVDKLFDYAPEKWTGISSIYNIISSQKILEIIKTLSLDEDFIKKDTEGTSQYYRSNAIKLYYCFLKAREIIIGKDSNLKGTNYRSNQPLQQIFYGAPGTGKSHTIKMTTDGVDSKFVVRTTFHPDSDYSTFVGAYKPRMEVLPRYNQQTGEQMGVEKRIVYAYTPQAFLKAYTIAWENPEQAVYLIIEEINRGNCAQIFGDLFQLLDRGDNGESCYPIKADQDMQMYLMEAFAYYSSLPENIRSGEELVLPRNLHIWATMNTSDQSLFPIDSAFKRRWEWKYVPITQGKNRETGKLIQWSIESEGVKYDWWSFLDVMNKCVASITSSEDKKLGFFFCKADSEGIISADKFVSKVLFYLWNDVFKDYPENPIAMHLKEEGAEFTYGDFYTTDAKGDVVVREELVTRLLEALEVKVVSVNEDEDENNSVDQEEEDSSTRKFSIIFADGTEVLEDRQFGSYAKALARIGLDKVEPIAAHLKYSRLGCPLVSKEEYDEILDNAQGYSYVNIDGYYIIKGINLRTMRNFLTQVSEELGLGLKLEVK